MDKNLKSLESIVDRAERTQTNLAGHGLSINRESNREYIKALRESIQTFRRNAEL